MGVVVIGLLVGMGALAVLLVCLVVYQRRKFGLGSVALPVGQQEAFHGAWRSPKLLSLPAFYLLVALGIVALALQQETAGVTILVLAIAHNLARIAARRVRLARYGRTPDGPFQDSDR